MKPSFSSFATSPIGAEVEHPWRTFPAPVDSYLDSSRRLILAAADQVQPRHVLVLGAGECYEIPLCELTRQFEAVTLQDFFPDTLQTATDKFDLSASQKSRIHSTIAELNGFEASHVDGIMLGLDQEADAASAAMIVTDRLLHLAPRPFVAAEKADLVVASCVLSQLHMPILGAIVHGFGQRFPDDADVLVESPDWRDVTFRLSEQLEHTFMHALRKNVTDEGRVYFSATIHLSQYRVTESGDWQSPGMMRACRFASLDEYTPGLFRIEHKEEFWWDITSTRNPGEIGHGYHVQGAILSPR